MDLSINLLGVYGANPGEPPVSVAEAVERAADDGFTVYDFPLADLAFYEGDWRTEIERAQRHAARRGAEFRYTHMPFLFPWADPSPANWERFERAMSQALDSAARLGVRYAALHPYTTNEPVGTYAAAPCRRAALEHLEPWLEQAGRLGVRLAVENMQGDAACRPNRRYCARVEELVELVDAINATTGGRHGICWDTGHGHIAGHRQSEALRAIGPRLAMTHLHDNDAHRDLHLVPYAGSIDWDDVVAGLRAIGFQGDLNYEMNLRRVPQALRPPLIDYLRQVGKALIGALQAP